MARVSVIEPNRTVSFAVESDVLPRIVAAISSNPSTLEQLLVAADAYQRGLTQRVMDELMAFDRALSKDGADAVRERILSDGAATYEATDEALIEHATKGDELMLIDLASRTITTSGLEVPRSGEVQIHDGSQATARTVTYELPNSWKLETR